jgi:aminoglycoside 6'-N-acetyltransferase
MAAETSGAGTRVPVSLPIRTARLMLRTHRSDDLEPLRAYYGDPDVARYLPFEAWDDDLARESLDKRLLRTGIEGDCTSLGVVAELDGRVIGDVVLWCADDTRLRAEIGWAFHPEVAGRGYATEAVLAVLDVAFGGYGMQRVFAELDSRNTASARLCERVGMTREAHLRRDWWGKGEWSDALVYGLLREEWQCFSAGRRP